MKRNIYILLALLVFSSCSASFLDEDPKNFEAPENIYVNSLGFSVATNGLYDYTRLEFQTWTNGVVQQGACAYEVLQVGTDLCLVAMGDGSLVPFEKYTFNNSNSYIRNRWKWAYGLIANANDLINKAENPAVQWANATDKEYYQAQAYFFRAYAYRYLTYLYGDVPWVTEVSPNYKADYVRTPKAEVLKNMIADLEKAAKGLPSDASKVKQGELTKWAALHLLSEICLFSGDYARAKSAALEIIDAKQYQLMENRFGKHTGKAGDFYSDLFKENNHNRSAGNLESIWVMQAEYDKQGGGLKYNDWTRRAWVPSYYNIKGFIISVEYGGRGLGQIRPMNRVLDSYEAKDVRNSEFNIRRDYYYNDPTQTSLYEKLHTITDLNIEKGYCFPTTTKFDYAVADNLTYEGVSKDRHRFRLSETYLFLAEACLRLNDIPGATAAINKVRSRALATPALESEVNMDYLLDERARELIGEEIRRFTLIRTGTLIERTKKYNAVSASLIKDHHVLWPVPQEVIDANSEVKWNNNPGY